MYSFAPGPWQSPTNWGLQQQTIVVLDLKARRLKSRCRQGCSLLRAVRVGSVPGRSSWLVDLPFTRDSPVCSVSKCPRRSIEREPTLMTSVWSDGPSPNKRKTLSPNKVIFWGWQLRLQHMNLGEHESTCNTRWSRLCMTTAAVPRGSLPVRHSHGRQSWGTREKASASRRLRGIPDSILKKFPLDLRGWLLPEKQSVRLFSSSPHLSISIN